MENIPGELPRNFRISAKTFPADYENPPSREGLDALPTSGSGQFSQEGLIALYKQIGSPDQLIVIDLREECHGFLNGNAVSWFADRDASNVGKTLSQIQSDESTLLQNLLKEPQIIVQKITQKKLNGSIGISVPITYYPKTVQTEQKLVESNKFKYIRIPVTDHYRPSQTAIDQFLAFYRQLPPDAKVHIHCNAGDGRTTTFLTMFDMLRNASKVSFEDIIARQHLIGGINLMKLPPHESWKYNPAKARADFIQEFYQFAKNYKQPPVYPMIKSQ